MGFTGFHIDKGETSSGSVRYFLMGPDELVWHESWTPTPRLRLTCVELNRAYELGKKAITPANDN